MSIPEDPQDGLPAHLRDALLDFPDLDGPEKPAPQRPLSRAQKRTLAILAQQADDQWAKGTRNLAGEINTPRRTLDKHLAALEAQGLVRVEEGVPGLAGEAEATTVRWSGTGLQERCVFAQNLNHLSLILEKTKGGEFLVEEKEILLARAMGEDATHLPSADRMFRVEEDRWNAGRCGYLGWQITLAAYVLAWPDFGVREMARWLALCGESVQPSTVMRRLRRMRQEGRDADLEAVQDERNHRWRIEVQAHLPVPEWDGLFERMQTAAPEERRAISDFLALVKPKDDERAEARRRQYDWESHLHRSVSRETYRAWREACWEARLQVGNGRSFRSIRLPGTYREPSLEEFVRERREEAPGKVDDW